MLEEFVILQSFIKYFVYLFLDRGERREKERERNISVWLPLLCPALGNLACNPGMCPDWEWNQQPFGSQAGTQSTEPQPARAELLIFVSFVSFRIYITKMLIFTLMLQFFYQYDHI